MAIINDDKISENAKPFPLRRKSINRNLPTVGYVYNKSAKILSQDADLFRQK